MAVHQGTLESIFHISLTKDRNWMSYTFSCQTRLLLRITQHQSGTGCPWINERHVMPSNEPILYSPAPCGSFTFGRNWIVMVKDSRKANTRHSEMNVLNATAGIIATITWLNPWAMDWAVNNKKADVQYVCIRISLSNNTDQNNRLICKQQIQ